MKRKYQMMRQMAYVLCASLVLQMWAPVGVQAEQVNTDNAEDIAVSTVSESHAATDSQEYGLGHFDLEDETLEEDKYPKVSLFSLEPETETEDELPATYRSDQVTLDGGEVVSYLPDGFRNQNPYGTCWTFSALGACEASLIRKGLADGNIDLSERHLAYYFYNKGETGDSKGGTYGDYNLANSDFLEEDETYVDLGGNSSLTMWHLVSWCGPVAESDVPYEGLLSNMTDLNGLLGLANSTQAAYENDVCHVQNVYKVAMGNINESDAQQKVVKKLIMKYGSLGLSYYSNSIYDSHTYDSYYNDTETGTNHAIQVVGWDDNFDKNRFEKDGEINPAPGNGAWLMKNSWGGESDYTAQPGYFWLSYYDASINSYVNTEGEIEMQYAYVYDAETSDNYDNIYQYDGDASTGRRTIYAGDHLAQRFTAGRGDGKCEKLRSVGIGVAETNVSGTVEIYKGLTNPETDPRSGTKVLTQEFDLEYAGYHTIPLTQEIMLEDGTPFSVIFSFDRNTYVHYSYDYNEEATANFGAWYMMYTHENPGVSFWRYSTNTGWFDMAQKYSQIFRIKAYTDNTDNDGTFDSGDDDDSGEDPGDNPGGDDSEDDVTDITPAILTALRLNQSATTMEDGDSLQLVATPTYSAGEATEWMVYWKSSDASVATVTNYGLVEALKPGTATITVYNGNISASCVVTVTPSKVKVSSYKETGKNKTQLKWKKADGATGYEIYRATSENGKYKKAKTITKASTVKATLKAYTGSKAYYYKVRAYKTISGKKVYGAFSSVKTCAPNAPSGAKAKAQSGRKIKVTWKKTANASGYEIYRATKKSGKYKKIATIKKAKTVSFVNKSLKKKKTYYYKIRAYRMVDGKKIYGSYSKIVSAKAK
nr:Ig-like domain-containing protein [Lachnospiraceae bacterium]